MAIGATYALILLLAEALGEYEYFSTASAGGTTTTLIDTTKKYETHEIDGKWIWWITGNNANKTRKVTGYDPSTGTITFAPAASATVQADTFMISAWTNQEWITAIATATARSGIMTARYDYGIITQDNRLEYDIPREIAEILYSGVPMGGSSDYILTDVAIQGTAKHETFPDSVFLDYAGGDDDWTRQARSLAQADVVFPITAVGDELKISLYQPFDEMEFEITTPADVVATLQFQYYTEDGWVNLATDHDLEDGTNQLTQSGTVKWTMPRTTWYPGVLTEAFAQLRTRPTFNVRIVCTAFTSTTTTPAIQRIKIKTCEEFVNVHDFTHRDSRIVLRDKIVGGRVMRIRVLIPISPFIAFSWPPLDPVLFEITAGQSELITAMAAARLYRLLLQRSPADMIDRIGKLYAMWKEEAAVLMREEGQTWEDMNTRRP